MSLPTLSRNELQLLKLWRQLQTLLIEVEYRDLTWNSHVRWDGRSRRVIVTSQGWPLGLRLNPRTLKVEANASFGLKPGYWTDTYQSVTHELSQAIEWLKRRLYV